MPSYENIFILKPDLPEEEIEEEISKAKELITNGGGEIDKMENWGKKRLAYQVAKNRFGHYIFLLFQSESHVISGLERYYKLNENIIKYMTIRLDEKRLASTKAKEGIHEENDKDESSGREKVELEEERVETFEPVEKSE